MSLTLTARQTLEVLLEDARRRIEVSPEELTEARRRRSAIAEALLAEFPGSRVYVNGSIAHGDALTPLTDIDLGIVVAGLNALYGPGKRGPLDLKERAAQAIRDRLWGRYEGLAVEVRGRKRSILVRFRDPVTPRQTDFTADVIIALDNPSARGLLIPRWDSWDRSDPETHTAMVLAAIARTEVSFARVVRLVKHWNRRHGKPLCSWNIKALALGCLSEPTALLPGLRTWLSYAATELAKGETADPAGVAPRPIKTNQPIREVVRILRDALTRLDRAIAFEQDGDWVLAHDQLARLFNDEDMLPRPDLDSVAAAEAKRIRRERAPASRAVGAAAVASVLTPSVATALPKVRSWAP